MKIVIACDQLHWRGQIEESRECYAELLRSSDSLAARAEAAWALKDLQTANSLFQQAMRLNPDDVVTRVRWGDLYADSHQDAEAMEIYREALERDENDPFAQLGAARVLAGGFDDAANAFLTPLLTDPTKADGARVGALLLSARVALENGRRDEAVNALDDAEEIVNRNDWPPLEIYALRAAVDLLNNVTESSWTEDVTRIQPILWRNLRGAGTFLRDYPPLSRRNRPLPESRRHRFGACSGT